MAKNPILSWLHAYAARERVLGNVRCDNWAGKAVVELAPNSLLDVGCGDGSFLFRYLERVPEQFYGVEGSPPRKVKAQERGIRVLSYDLNSRWPFEANEFDVIFASQIIEHLHNTRLFIDEMHRVLKPGGTAIVTSENLCSLLNCIALVLGYTPFSLMQVCGRYLGNPLGLHYQEPLDEPLPDDDPAFAGVSGHIRVLSLRQARELFEQSGFKVDLRSISILPLPDLVSRALENFINNRGHYLLIRARK